MNWDAISAVASAISALIAASALYVSAKVSLKLHKEQIRYNRRQALLPIWKEMAELSRIDPDNPNNEAFRVSLNLLLLVAKFAELEVVEEPVLKEMFGGAYINVYNDIAAVNKVVTVNGVTKSGRDFLADSKQLKRWYDKWLSVG